MLEAHPSAPVRPRYCTPHCHATGLESSGVELLSEGSGLWETRSTPDY